MSNDDIPTSAQITLAQTQRQRRRRGALRARIVVGVFGAAIVFGFIGGCTAPGA